MIDFQTAFGSMEHDATRKAIQRQSVPERYVDLLQRLYDGESASVLTDVRVATLNLGGEKVLESGSGRTKIIHLQCTMWR